MDTTLLSHPLAHKIIHASQYWLSKPFQIFITAEERVFIPYLITGILVALIALCVIQRQPLKLALQQIFSKKVYGHEDTKCDIQYFFVNTILFWLVLIPMTAGALTLSSAFGSHLVELAGLKGSLGVSNGWTIGAFTILTVLLNDLGVYITHRLQHTIPFFWQFHKTHHSAEVLSPLTEYRIHPVDFLLGFVISFVLVGFADGLFRGLYIGQLEQWKVWGVNIIEMVYYATFFNLRHSHIWIDFGNWDKLIISPAQHQIHHSVDPKHWDKNYGQMLGVWDWVFGSAYFPQEKEEIVVGLGDPVDQKNYKSLFGLYFSPVVSAWELLGFKAKKPESITTQQV